MKLTFDYIRKNCKSGEHLLVNNNGEKRLYLGFNRNGALITDCSNQKGSNSWEKEEIENWTIEKYEKPIEKVLIGSYRHWYFSTLDAIPFLHNLVSHNKDWGKISPYVEAFHLRTDILAEFEI